MIVDCHAHIRDGNEKELKSILHVADRAGIDRLCIISLSREWSEFPTSGQLEEAAADVLAACEKHPDRFVGAVYLSADHVEESLDLMERCLAEGPCHVIKLWISQYADDPRLNPIIEKAIELDTPILQHTWTKATGNMTKESTYHHVVNMAERYPAMKMWIAHCGGRWEEAARIIEPFPNIRMDLSGGEPEDGIVECLLKHVEPERIMFGSDLPGRNPYVQICKVLSADIPRRYKRMILGENIEGWLHD
jgi:predicted TIM-barrel fold metal-dependent hydrolase